MVLVELLNFFAERGEDSRRAAAEVVRRLREKRSIELLPQTSTLFRRAVELCNQRPDKAWSLTDCASMIQMEEQEIEEVLTSDRHFEQTGFRILLRKSMKR